MGHQLEDYDIPGATVSVVKDGEVFFTYLDVAEVPNTYPGRPITLRHLLTHTAGFEERFTGSGARNAAGVEPLGEYVAAQMPTRVRPPGEVTAYSNYGMSLAGYIVQEISGMPYERYVEENILVPLGMESTTAAQPPAPKLRERLATGYEVEGVEPVAKHFEYLDDAPASTVSTTAADMARFMIAHLQNGRYGGLNGETRILEESTAKEMHERQFSNHPRLDGMAYGFYEQTINGERTIQYGATCSSSTRILHSCPSTMSVSSWRTIATGTAGTSPSTSWSKPSSTATTPSLRRPPSSPPARESPGTPSVSLAATASPARTIRGSRRS